MKQYGMLRLEGNILNVSDKKEIFIPSVMILDLPDQSDTYKSVYIFLGEFLSIEVDSEFNATKFIKQFFFSLFLQFTLAEKGIFLSNI